MKKISRKMCSWFLIILMVCLLAEPVFADASSDQNAADSASESYVEESDAQTAKENQKENDSEQPEPVEVSSIGISRSELSLAAGDTAKLTATVEPENADNRNVAWTSSDPAVAAVDAGGMISAGTAGTAMITVTTEDGGLAASCSVTVNEAAAKEPADAPAASSSGTAGSSGAVETSESDGNSTKGKTGGKASGNSVDAGEETVSKPAAKAGNSEEEAEAYKTSLPDGEYPIDADAYLFEGGTGKAKLTCTKVTVKNGIARGTFVSSSTNMTHVYYGGHTDSDTDDVKYYDPVNDRCGEKVVPIHNQEAVFPVVLNAKTKFSARTTAMSEPHWIQYYYTISLEEPEVFETTVKAVDAETGTELQDAVITVKDQSSGSEVSGKGGIYSLTAGCRYSITAAAENYERQTRSDYEPAADGTVELKLKHIDSSEERICSLTVKATDRAGKLITNAKAEVIRETEDQTVSIKEKNGVFPVAAGKMYTLRVSAVGYQTKEQVVNITEDSTETVVLEQELCKVHVRVIDADTQYNLSKASVSVKDGNNQTIAGTNGTYEVPYGTVLAITAGNTGYRTKDGASTALQTVTASGEQTITFEFVKQTYRVKVSVTDAAAGSAIAGASVTVKDGSTGQTVSASGGTYAMQYGNIYTISASAANYAAASVTHKATSDTTVTVRLEPTKNSASGSGSGSSAAAQTEQIVNNGTYNVKYKDAENNMFNVVGVVLHVKDGKYTADISLSGTGYDYVYPSTGAEAIKAGQSKWSKYWKNKDGKYTYTIEVPYLDKPFILASRSIRYANDPKMKDQAWRDGTEGGDSSHGSHEIIIYSKDSSGKKLPTHAGVRKESSIKAATDSDSGSSGSTSKKSKSSKKKTKSSKKTSSGSSTSGSKSGSSGTGNGSTGAVNNQTGLKDGSYKPDSFSFSGGTGRLKITCDEIIIQGGKTYARIVFSSTYIQYVKAGGQKITDYTRGSDSTSFVIPVELNKNNTILALTTKMSQPHEIAYQLYIGLEAAKTAGTGSGAAGGSGGSGSGTAGAAAAGQTEGKVDDQYDKLDEKAPEIMGLTFEKEIPVEHADLFKLYQYADGYKLIELDVHKRTAMDEDLTGIRVETGGADQTSAGDSTAAADASDAADSRDETVADADAQTGDTGAQNQAAVDEEGSGDMAETASEQKAALYRHAVYKYLLVPEGKEIPAGIDKQLFVVQMPLDRTAVASSASLEAMDKLGLTDQIAGVGIPEDEITVDSIKKAVQSKDGAEPEIPTVGTIEDLDYKTLLMNKMNMLFVPAELLPQPGAGELKDFTGKTKEDFADLTDDEKKEFAELAAKQAEKLATIGKRGVQLNMGVIADRSADEETDLAKAEWLKVYGILYGRETEADELYQKAGGTSEADLEKNDAADAGEDDTNNAADGDTAAEAAQGTAAGMTPGVTDPVLRILNLRNKLEGVPKKETTCEERDGFLYMH